jgi:hypothetical protein
VLSVALLRKGQVAIQFFSGFVLTGGYLKGLHPGHRSVAFMAAEDSSHFFFFSAQLHSPVFSWSLNGELGQA